MLVILLDDVGFGASKPIWWPHHRSANGASAANGLKYNGLHTDGPLFTHPAALLSGRNHHARRDGRHH